MLVDTVDDIAFAPFIYRHGRSLEEPFALIVPGIDVETMPPAVLRKVGPNPLASLVVSPVGWLNRLGQSILRGGDEISRHLRRVIRPFGSARQDCSIIDTIEG
jgi:hypothetical protein